MRTLFWGTLLLLVSCSETNSQPMYEKMEHQHIDRTYLTGIAVAQTKKELKKLYGFKPCMTGGGAAGALQMVSLGGDISYNCTIEEARRMIVNGTIIFQNNINSIRKLRPTMRVYPFPLTGMSLSFFSTNSKRDGSTLSSFSMSQGRVWYDVETQDGHLKIIKEETFEEAKEIVENERKKEGITAPLSMPTSQLKEFPLRYEGSKYEYRDYPDDAKLEKYLRTYCVKLAQKHHILFLWTGNFSGTYKGIYYGISFYGFDPHTLEESRKLVHDILSEYYTMLQTSPVIKDFQENKQKQGFKYYTDIPPIDESCIKITFWDEQFNPLMPPNIAQITFLNEKYSYYQADPTTHELTLVYEEPYTAAQNKEINNDK